MGRGRPYSSLRLGMSLRPLEVRVTTGALGKMNRCDASERQLCSRAMLRCTTSSTGQSKPKPCYSSPWPNRSHNATWAVLYAGIFESSLFPGKVEKTRTNSMQQMFRKEKKQTNKKTAHYVWQHALFVKGATATVPTPHTRWTLPDEVRRLFALYSLHEVQILRNNWEYRILLFLQKTQNTNLVT